MITGHEHFDEGWMVHPTYQQHPAATLTGFGFPVMGSPATAENYRKSWFVARHRENDLPEHWKSRCRQPNFCFFIPPRQPLRPATQRTIRHKLDTNPVFSYFCAMKNITISMPEDLARKIRVLAAQADTSMSQFMCRLAEQKAAEHGEYEAAMNRYLSRQRGGIRTEGGPLPSRESLYDRDVFRRH